MKYSESEITEALKAADGVVSHAALLLGCDPATVKGHISRYPAVRALVRDGRGVRKPQANSNGRPVVSPEPTSNSAVAAVTSKQDIPAYYRQRSGRIVTIEQSPTELTNVFSLEMKINGRFMKLPLFGDMRVCVGHEVPRWTPDQEVIRDVSALRVTYTDGRTEEINVGVEHAVTVAPLTR